MGLSQEQRDILTKALDGHSLAILGQSGTGKSFLVKEINKTFREKNKCVQLTATTGIESVNIGGKTIHSWSGIGDGRFSDKALLDKLEKNEHYKVYKANITNTQCLIIDEISILSRKLFEQLEFICRNILNSSYIFGGLQVIVLGDFFQLPPVPDELKMDPGEYCFSSPVFHKFFGHKFVLTTVMRQHQEDFVKAINDVSRGELPDDTHNLIRRLSRNLPPGEDPIRLCAKNFDCELYNACKLMDMDGEEYVFHALDEGDQSKLEKLSIPKHLHIKLGSPVMLLKNLNANFVNGLRGIVTSVAKESITIDFSDVNFTETGRSSSQIEIKKEIFTVYSSIDSKVVASRKQFPLCLAFSITIHKAQRLTLDRVIVDASCIFAPGQLGVAIGRAREKKGLRVIGFKKSTILKHNESLYKYYDEKPNDNFDESGKFACCKTQFDIKKKQQT